ncbi:MAG: hypothetical protein JRM97_08430 [Nitrososphaerota archaeon]|jgi:hypothetical protein|nr:hypothetical protein [Nitrososphaerota archaeon]MDG6974453.1 hypothetical protein [Nitrososphaerota archaeon]MDG7032638.1 hypothetical protein [Nitrososphaerota archaeon]
MADDPTVKDALLRALAVGGIECGHHITFSKWVPAGSDVGLVEITALSQFRKHLVDGDGEYFLDLENVKITGVADKTFFVSYLGFNLSVRSGKWVIQPYSDEEELPHDVDVKSLEERSHVLSEKVLSIVQLVASLLTSA